MFWPNSAGAFRTGIEGFVIKLLIADDSALMRKLLEGIFRDEGDFDIQLARNGTEALDLVRSFDPHVVTLDVQMPGMDGLSCLSQIMIEAPRPGGDGFLADRGGRRCNAGGHRARRGRFRRQAERHGFAGDRSPASRSGREGSRCRQGENPPDASAEGAHQASISRRGRSAAADSSGSARIPPDRHAVGAGAGPDRHFDRWPGRARCGAAAAAEAVAMAGDGRPAHAGELHGGLRQTA